MTDERFQARLAGAASVEDLGQLAYDVIEDAIGLIPEAAASEPELRALPERIAVLLDHGLDPNVVVEENICIFGLQYGYCDYFLDAAKLIFDRWSLPAPASEDGDSFFSWLRTRLDYDYYNCAPIVKLYLLCSAYCEEETYLHFSPDLYAEMFDPSGCYTSKVCLAPESQPLKLTPAIFKEIHKYDFCVEMLTQEAGTYGCWRLHIFDNESKIEVATYE